MTEREADHLLRTTNAIKERLDGFERAVRGQFKEVNHRFDRVEERLNGIDGRLCRIEQDVRSNTSILAHLAESVAMIQDHLTKMPEIGDRLREAAHDLRESLKMPSEEPH